MSPSQTHESVPSMIGSLVETWCLERGIPYLTIGSWTLKSKPKSRGVEPDESYFFGDPKAAERPHLAIEVVGTAGRIDKLAIDPLRHRHRVGPGRGPRSWGHALSAWNRASAATVGIRLFH